jgi:hypothetical protein
MVGRSQWVGLWVLLASNSAAASPTQLTLCVDSPRLERVGAELLQTSLPALRFVLASRAHCASAARGFRGWFEQRGAKACFVLARSGVQRSRCLPWLPSAHRALARMEASGKLATFSVVLQALVAEHELSWLLESPPSGAPASRVAASRVATTRAAPRRAFKVSTQARAPAPPVAPPTVAAPPTAEPAKVATVTRPADEPGASWPATASKPAAKPASTAAGVPGIPLPVRRAPVPRVAMVSTPEPARVEVERRSEPTIARRAARVRWDQLVKDLALEAMVGGRWRSGDLWSLDVGGALVWRSFFVRAGYQPAAQWSLERRPVQVTVVPLSAGWRPRLWSRGAVWLRANVAALVERFTLRRTDVGSAQDHSAWDAGLAAGLDLGLRWERGMTVGLEAGGFYFPAAREISIGENGASARLTTLGVRFGLTVAWEGRLLFQR